jgi:hypothetical protein
MNGLGINDALNYSPVIWINPEDDKLRIHHPKSSRGSSN